MIKKSEVLELIEERVNWLKELEKCHLRNNDTKNLMSCSIALEELTLLTEDIMLMENES